MCVTVPNIVVMLLQRRLWRKLMLLARWLFRSTVNPVARSVRRRRHGRSEDVASGVDPGPLSSLPGWFAEWPPRQWLFDVGCEHEQGREEEAGFPCDIAVVASTTERLLRRWHPTILAAIVDEEERRGEELALLSAVRSLQGLQPRKVQHTLRHSAQKLMLAVECAQLLKSGSAGLREVCFSAFRLLLPGFTAEASVATLPSSTQVRYHTFSMDLAYVLLERELDAEAAESPVRYGFHDSSPMWGHDWLWSQYHVLPGGDALLEVFSDAHILIRGLLEWQAQPHGDDPSYWKEACAAPQILMEAMRRIHSSFRSYTQPPMVIASGYAGLVHKLSASIQGAALARPTLESLLGFCDSFVSMTTDMGTEMGMGDFRAAKLSDVLPPWLQEGLEPFSPDMAEPQMAESVVAEMQVDMPEASEAASALPSALGVDPGPRRAGPMPAPAAPAVPSALGVDPGPRRAGPTPAPAAPVVPSACGVDPGPPGACAEEGSSFVFRHALTIPGTLHIFHNLCANMETVFPEWSEFWQQLRAFEAILRKPFRRARLISSCVLTTAGAGKAEVSALETFSCALYDKRWGSVTAFVGELMPLLPLLQRVWSERKWVSNADTVGAARGEADPQSADDGKGFDPGVITRSLASGLFHARLLVVHHLQGAVQEFAAWTEACPCHEVWFRALSTAQRQRYMESAVGPGAPSCIFMGKRAPEMAGGKPHALLRELCGVALNGVLEQVQGGLSVQELQAIQGTFQSCKNHLFLHLTLKLHFWSQPPYVFCGLAHWDENVARQCAASGRAVFEKHPERSLHHRVTWEVCHIRRSDLDAFIAGRRLEDLSRGFRLLVAQLLFIPITERGIESKHALATMALQSAHWKGSPVGRLVFAL